MDKSDQTFAKDISIGAGSLFSLIERASIKYDVFTLNPDLSNVIKPRNRFAHKYTCGRVLSVCGSYGMAGAAIISARAAFRCGSGLVDIAAPDSIYPIITSALPEAICTPLPCSQHLLPKHVGEIKSKLKKADSLLIGCGIGCHAETAAAVKNLLNSTNIPTVIDADGINCIKESIEILEQTGWDKIITPHFGEFARISGYNKNEIENDYILLAADFAKEHNVIVVLKGAFTIVATPDGNVYVNLRCGNQGMAVAGSGDMLAGMIASFLAEGISPVNACCAAVYLHALAGDIAAKELSMRSLTPSDMIEILPRLFKSIE